jgi:spermidine synthase
MSAHRINILKRIGSYCFDVHIETTGSEHNAHLEVLLSKGRYLLNTPNATYSYEDLYTSYATALSHVKPDPASVRSILLLGLGLGSIPYILQKTYNMQCPISCVEIDQLIITLCKKYYPSHEGLKKLEIHHADAFIWTQQNKKQFDLVTVDLFVDKNVPRKLHKIEFISALKQCVSPGGNLLFSRLKNNKEHEYLLWENLSEILPGGHDIETMGNAIYHWKNC